MEDDRTQAEYALLVHANLGRKQTSDQFTRVQSAIRSVVEWTVAWEVVSAQGLTSQRPFIGPFVRVSSSVSANPWLETYEAIWAGGAFASGAAIAGVAKAEKVINAVLELRTHNVKARSVRAKYLADQAEDELREFRARNELREDKITRAQYVASMLESATMSLERTNLNPSDCSARLIPVEVANEIRLANLSAAADIMRIAGIENDSALQ